MTRWSRFVPYLQVAPLTLVLLVFLGMPLAVVVAVSFFDYDDFTVYPAFLRQKLPGAVWLRPDL